MSTLPSFNVPYHGVFFQLFNRSHKVIAQALREKMLHVAISWCKWNEITRYTLFQSTDYMGSHWLMSELLLTFSKQILSRMWFSHFFLFFWEWFGVTLPYISIWSIILCWLTTVLTQNVFEINYGTCSALQGFRKQNKKDSIQLKLSHGFPL